MEENPFKFPKSWVKFGSLLTVVQLQCSIFKLGSKEIRVAVVE